MRVLAPPIGAFAYGNLKSTPPPKKNLGSGGNAKKQKKLNRSCVGRAGVVAGPGQLTAIGITITIGTRARVVTTAATSLPSVEPTGIVGDTRALREAERTTSTTMVGEGTGVGGMRDRVASGGGAAVVAPIAGGAAGKVTAVVADDRWMWLLLIVFD